jgi:hypothetical protein
MPLFSLEMAPRGGLIRQALRLAQGKLSLSSLSFQVLSRCDPSIRKYSRDTTMNIHDSRGLLRIL